MKNVLLLPCDTRPPTLEYPHQLARAAGLEMRSPPPSMLNNLNIPGDTKAITAWLREGARWADVAIITLETLCLGGMIPARRVTDSLEVALERLELLPELKRLNPNLRILAYGVIVRVAHDNDPFEEKPYYGEWGKQLRLVSEWTDRVDRRGITGSVERDQDVTMLEQARAAVPKDILGDWLGTRERNHALHQRALELLADGTLEHLCLTLDDTTPYGLAARDRRRLEARIDALQVWDRADVYPGADEVAAVLLARAMVNHSGRKPKVFVRYPSTQAEQAVMLYEDRLLGELVKAHLRAAGCVPASRPNTADLIFAVNAPASKQAHRQPNFEVVDTANRHLPEFLGRIQDDLEAQRLVVIADVAYANGAEDRLIKLLLENIDVTKLAGFGAWNTAGNTLGGAIASGVIALECRDPMALQEANFSRFVDDWLYQGRVRGEVREVFENPSPFDLGELRSKAETEIANRITPLARALFDEHFAPRMPGVRLEWGRPHLAWPRLFTGVFPLRFKRNS
jgi:Protein of unknown function (DUF4127)